MKETASREHATKHIKHRLVDDSDAGGVLVQDILLQLFRGEDLEEVLDRSLDDLCADLPSQRREEGQAEGHQHLGRVCVRV